MARYIDAEDTIEELQNMADNVDKDFCLLDRNSQYMMERGLRIAVQYIINLAPTADVAPIKHGKWIDTEAYTNHHGHIYECSNCHNEVADDFIVKHTYCLHCGAKMG